MLVFVWRMSLPLSLYESGLMWEGDDLKAGREYERVDVQYCQHLGNQLLSLDLLPMPHDQIRKQLQDQVILRRDSSGLVSPVRLKRSFFSLADGLSMRKDRLSGRC